jgi:hypothetical protein
LNSRFLQPWPAAGIMRLQGEEQTYPSSFSIQSCRWHGHECSLIWKLSGNFIKKCRDFLGRDILGTTFSRVESSLIQSSCRSFIRVIVPYETGFMLIIIIRNGAKTISLQT